MATKRPPHAWPTKGIRPLSAAKRYREGKVFHLDSIFLTYPVHAEAFLRAAEMVLDGIAADRRDHHDELFFPVAYLYRHCLELKLKDLVRIGIARGFFTKKSVDAIIGKHALLPLWQAVRRFLESEWQGAPSNPLDGIETVVKQFNKADPDGQTLRYDRDRKGRLNSHEKLPRFIGQRNLRKTMAGVFNLLDTCETLVRDCMSDGCGP